MMDLLLKIGLGLLGALVCFVAFMTYVTFKIFNSVKPCKPKGRFLKEDLSKCQLFKYIPEMKGKIAWMNLENNYPTPVHKLDLKDNNGVQMPIWLKREDLSNDRYGGNKVRTMEFLMANAKCQIGKDNWLHAFGGAGSNNCVISALVGKLLGMKVNIFYGTPEGASYDNSLNTLSCYSLAAKISPAAFEWFPWSMLNYFYRLFFSNDLFLFLGGQSVLGTLGHVAAIFEIAEDIERGACPEPAYITLPAGSGCTSSGIMLGIALARTKGIGFKRPHKDFKLHPVFVLPEQSYIKPLYHAFTMMAARRAAKLIADNGGPDARPELEKLSSCMELIGGYQGVYGAHTEKTVKCKKMFDEAMKDRPDIPSPWICSCFTGKSGGFMMDLMEKLQKEGTAAEKPILFWQTKTFVQPYGDPKIKDFMNTLPPGPLKYVMDGGVKSPEDVWGQDRQQIHPVGGVRMLDMNSFEETEE